MRNNVLLTGPGTHLRNIYETTLRIVELRTVILSSKLKSDILPVEIDEISPRVEDWGKRRRRHGGMLIAEALLMIGRKAVAS